MTCLFKDQGFYDTCADIETFLPDCLRLGADSKLITRLFNDGEEPKPGEIPRLDYSQVREINDSFNISLVSLFALKLYTLYFGFYILDYHEMK